MVKPFYLTITTFLEGGFLWLNKHDYIEAQLIPIFFKNFLLSNKTNKPPKDNKNSYI